MKLYLIFLVLFTSFLFFFAILQLLLNSNKRLEKRMKKYLTLDQTKPINRKRFNFMVQMQIYNQRFRQSLRNKKYVPKLEEKLQRAGVPLKPEEFILFQWISMALFAGLFILISGHMILGGIGLVVGYVFPKYWLKRKTTQRVQKFNNALPDVITTIIGSLRAGFSFAQALKAVAEEFEEPVKEELEIVLKEMQYGNTIEDSLNQLKERMPSEDLDLMIQAILIQRQVGGNLATVLDNIVQTIRDRNKIQRQILTLTAQGRMSGMVIGLLPLGLGVTLFLIEPEYIGTLFTHPVGIAMLVAGVFFGIIGFILIKKMTTIEV